MQATSVRIGSKTFLGFGWTESATEGSIGSYATANGIFVRCLVQIKNNKITDDVRVTRITGATHPLSGVQTSSIEVDEALHYAALEVATKEVRREYPYLFEVA